MSKDREWSVICAYERSKSWEDQFKGEYYALVKRIHGLEKCVKDLQKYDSHQRGYIHLDFPLPKASIEVLKAQLHAMKAYRGILRDRANQESIDL